MRLFEPKDSPQYSPLPHLELTEGAVGEAEEKPVSNQRPRRAEKKAYLDAAQCLATTVSPRDPSVTIHDELSLLHSRTGNYSHNAAPFLPWHRYFIHAYEQALHTHCNYTGTLPYWDWTLDHTNLLLSPIWDPNQGFGSNGTGPPSVAGGHCIQDGPFSGLTVSYFEGNYHPHCLSRGFLNEETIQRVGNLTVRPAVHKDIIIQSSKYFDFLLAVEQMSHLTIPYIVQGDFSKVTAPNGTERKGQYNGLSGIEGIEEAGVMDWLEFGGVVAESLRVADVMDTEGEVLCYQYDVDAVTGNI
ncbi:Di-copper centre-containing protein [Aspergillus sclerotiicarbonarius CBS 121057]|uniref:Di-copper centre-containing protein n=1 Tax=Aspergillus sclerotiicarbonarius (strain CBS 121057 / IBT 28362) TaxID=1448318 RepID=A0A319ET75_ASPSB|nr:Di-copper centre-containing protein [Aspergillus sclerotiicarbonarius CBS 121057]